MSEIETTLVVGAGTMGHGFAQIFAANKVKVILVDTNHQLLEQAQGWIQENLKYMVELGELEAPRIKEIMALIEPATDLAQAAPKADYVLEAVNENLELKKSVFELLDRETPPAAILTTNTSSYDINEIAAATRSPERVIGTHWFHPPPITPCVEVIPGEATSPETTRRTMEFMTRIGKAPTLCRSAPGFVANRIQLAMAAEALAIVEAGLASPEEVDRIVKTSFGFRLGAYGPFEIMDQAGSDTYQAVYEYLYGKLKREQFKPSPVLGRLIEEKNFGLKTRKGFYEYGPGAVESMKRDRDKKFYARLRLFREEEGGV